MSAGDNLDFVPKPMDAVGIEPGEGASIRISMAIVQRTTALRAYDSYANCRDWMEKLSTAYVVAIATRSADTLLMQHIQNHIAENPPIICAKCREATIGTHVIRRRLFPTLKVLRAHANTLIHHFDDPENRGMTGLNVQGVFDYCHLLFQGKRRSSLWKHSYGNLQIHEMQAVQNAGVLMARFGKKPLLQSIDAQVRSCIDQG